MCDYLGNTATDRVNFYRGSLWACVNVLDGPAVVLRRYNIPLGKGIRERYGRLLVQFKAALITKRKRITV